MPASRLLLGAALVLGFTGCQTPRAAPAAPGARLGSTVFKFETLATRADADGLRREVTNQPTATLDRFEAHIITLNPGRLSPDPPRQPQEELFILTEGTLKVTVNGRAQTVGAGSVGFFASNDLHRLENVGATPATCFVFNFTTAATYSAPAAGAVATARPGCLASGVFDWEKLAVLPLPTGRRRDIISSPTVTCTNLDCRAYVLLPGESPNPPHHHPDESFIVVTRGLLDVTIKGVTQRVGPGGICFFASNDEHGLKNSSPTPVSYYGVHVITAATPPLPPVPTVAAK
jgi:quercetin dioxygenase-like cupin family protein